MSKRIKEEVINDSKGIRILIEGIVKPFGGSGHLTMPKKYIGKKAKIYFMAEIKQEWTPTVLAPSI